MPDSSLGVGACRHCWHQKLLRPRALCWSCYYTPGVRESYPPVSPYGNREGSRFGEPVDAVAIALAAGGDAPPTADRMAVMAHRAARGLAVRPDDAYLTVPP